MGEGCVVHLISANFVNFRFWQTKSHRFRLDIALLCLDIWLAGEMRVQGQTGKHEGCQDKNAREQDENEKSKMATEKDEHADSAVCSEKHIFNF